FLVMQFMHMSINVLSLMGLSCAVGTLVANSVVVLENIFRHKDNGLGRVQAASTGTKEVIMAVVASTATNVAVFVPISTMPGAMGQILGSFAIAVVIATVFSLVVAFTVAPLLASRLIPEQTKKPGVISLKIDGFFKKLEVLYGKSIAYLLTRKRRAAAFIAGVVAVFILSVMGFSKIEQELIPKSDGGKVHVDVELPQGSSLEMTALVLTEIESRLMSYGEVRNMLTILGNAGGSNIDVSVAQMNISLVPKKQRSRSNDEVAAAMTRTLSDLPGADIKVTAPPEFALMAGAPIDLFIRGYDSAVLQNIGDELRDRVAAIPGITNADINTKSGKRELVFEPNRKQIFQDGLTVQAVAMSLRSAIDGLVTTTYKEGGAEYDIRVKMSGDALRDIEDIRNIPVVTNTGIFPLSRYADVNFEASYNQIMRENKQRAIRLQAHILPGYTQGSILSEVMKQVGEMDIPAGYNVAQAGLSDSMSESMVQMAIVFLTAILLTYMLLAAILESLKQPLFILSTIPLSIIGITAACLLTGTVLNNIAMIGIVMLVGIVVNNAILILDYYNQLRKEGLSIQDAMFRACPAKLKAILMSNIAIILGTIPMALGIGESLAEMRQPMGIVISGGIVSSMIMTLWLVPCLEFASSKRVKKGEPK
ncbi:MAG: efflux RND transporter permease subunit, partial [Treponema sp.]|nr:efflux RND transporter permease subunit [Treponema sp.]